LLFVDTSSVGGCAGIPAGVPSPRPSTFTQYLPTVTRFPTQAALVALWLSAFQKQFVSSFHYQAVDIYCAAVMVHGFRDQKPQPKDIDSSSAPMALWPWGHSFFGVAHTAFRQGSENYKM
jgi:hypothetical protein